MMKIEFESYDDRASPEEDRYPESTALETDLESTGEDTSLDESEVEALESHYMVLEDLVQSMKGAGKLTATSLRLANEALPEARFAHTNLSHDQLYQFAMESLETKISELKAQYEALTKK